jgi:hypothetical protein
MNTSATTTDPDVANILQMLMDWHEKKRSELQLIVTENKADLVFGDKKIPASSDMARGIRLGVGIALESLGKLPITLTKTEPADPWQEGNQAYRDGLPMSACPYPHDDSNCVEWEGGWMAAEEEED